MKKRQRRLPGGREGERKKEWAREDAPEARSLLGALHPPGGFLCADPEGSSALYVFPGLLIPFILLWFHQFSFQFLCNSLCSVSLWGDPLPLLTPTWGACCQCVAGLARDTLCTLCTYTLWSSIAVNRPISHLPSTGTRSSAESRVHLASSLRSDTTTINTVSAHWTALAKKMQKKHSWNRI